MKKFLIEWDEVVRNSCWVEIEAETKDEALEKFDNGEYDDYDRDERINTFDGASISIKEIK